MSALSNEPTFPALPSRLRIVLDTNIVLEDIWYSARTGKKTRLQSILQDPKQLVFMAESIADEVIPKLHEHQRGDVEVQIQLWHSTYEPNIFIVRLRPEAYLDDPRIQQMRDLDDIPTGQLALFLCPDYLFSCDAHLDAFARTPEAGETMAAYQDLRHFYGQAGAVTSLPVLGMLLTGESLRFVRRFPPLIQMLLSGVAIGTLVIKAPAIWRKIGSVLRDPNTQAFIGQVLEKVEGKFTIMSKASIYIQDRLPDLAPTETVLQHLVEILAVVDEALTLDDISWYLLAREYQPKGETSKQYILSILRKHACFQMSTDGYWELVGMD